MTFFEKISAFVTFVIDILWIVLYYLTYNSSNFLLCWLWNDAHHQEKDAWFHNFYCDLFCWCCAIGSYIAYPLYCCIQSPPGFLWAVPIVVYYGAMVFKVWHILFLRCWLWFLAHYYQVIQPKDWYWSYLIMSFPYPLLLAILFRYACVCILMSLSACVM